MKAKLPKALLYAIIAASMTSTTTFAATKAEDIEMRGTHSPVDIINVAAGKEIAIESDSAETAPTQYSVVAKDGEGTATITGNVTKYHALMVREGEVTVGDGNTSTSLTVKPSFAGASNYRTGISVAGKNAQLTVNKASVSFATSETQLSVGGGSGNGTITIDNGSTVNLDNAHLITVGDQYWVDGTYTTKTSDTPYRGSYTVSPIDNKTILGKGVINVQGESKLSVGNGMGRDYGSAWMGEGEINVTGKNSSATFCEKDGGYRFIMNEDEMSTSSINVKEGASSVINFALVYTNFRKNTIANITVDGASSSLIIGNTTTKKYNSETHIAGKNLENTVANINITEGGNIDFRSKDTILGSESGSATVNFKVDSKSSASFVNATINRGTVLDNEGTITAASIVMNGGILYNDGIIESNMKMFGGTYIGDGSADQFGGSEFTILDGAVVEGLTMTSGTVNISGTVTLTDVTFGSIVAAANFLMSGDAGSALTINITNGSTINADDVTIGDGAAITLVLDETDTTGSVTIIGSNEEAIATLMDSLKDKINVVDASGNTVEGASYDINTQVVPEPTTATLSLLALCGLAMRRRRK